MWPAMVIALLVGIGIGYLSAKILLDKPSPLIEEFDKLSEENDRLQQQEKQLQQDVADLKYRLGEEEKARTYYQKKAENQEQG